MHGCRFDIKGGIAIGEMQIATLGESDLFWLGTLGALGTLGTLKSLSRLGTLSTVHQA